MIPESISFSLFFFIKIHNHGRAILRIHRQASRRSVPAVQKGVYMHTLLLQDGSAARSLALRIDSNPTCNSNFTAVK